MTLTILILVGSAYSPGDTAWTRYLDITIDDRYILYIHSGRALTALQNPPTARYTDTRPRDDVPMR